MQHDPKKRDFGPPPKQGAIWPRLWRGLKSRCPCCGLGKLFQSFLKPVPQCSVCEEPWENVRADLAPAWAAMTLSAHVTVAIWHFFFWRSEMPNWQLTGILCAIGVGVCLLSLPAMKGLFMAIVWAKGTRDS